MRAIRFFPSSFTPPGTTNPLLKGPPQGRFRTVTARVCIGSIIALVAAVSSVACSGATSEQPTDVTTTMPTSSAVTASPVCDIVDRLESWVSTSYEYMDSMQIALTADPSKRNEAFLAWRDTYGPSLTGHIRKLDPLVEEASAARRFWRS